MSCASVVQWVPSYLCDSGQTQVQALAAMGAFEYPKATYRNGNKNKNTRIVMMAVTSTKNRNEMVVVVVVMMMSIINIFTTPQTVDCFCLFGFISDALGDQVETSAMKQ